ncbi:ferredoxin-fold anticodon-binding domain-containing protein 1 homolog [Littorina saxatilis]|uniref:phenylalanine--tRNA ligase n=1 Tax=Littorina saxatilis TaxID=31220 RepID=A0AAN9B4Z8_9CAEN
MNQPTEGRILLVGEGNFSLSASLIENRTVSGPQLTASCIDTFVAVQESHRLAASNIAFLEKARAMVLFEVDAVDMHNHPDIKLHEYERVVFNFPLADRHNIKKNRALLSDFFSSVKNILDSKRGQVMVTLCKGQGGTPADQPMRSWHDSWQAVSMAANAGLILTQIYPFQTQDFPRYHSVGFRFQDKCFNTDSALVHVFEMARSVTVPSVDASRRFIHQDNQDFVVSAYIRRKLDRWSLLEKENHPLHRLHQHLVTRLSATSPSPTVLHSNHPALPTVLGGHKSWLAVNPGHDAEMEPEDTIVNPEGADKVSDCGSSSRPSSKQLKDLENIEKAAAVVEDSTGDAKLLPGVSGPGLSGRSFRHGVERDGTEREAECAEPCGSASKPATGVLACVSSPVFVVHKMTRPRQNESVTSGVSGDDGASSEVKAMDTDDDAQEPEPLNGAASQTSSKPESTEENGILGTVQSATARSLFHLRSSLFENLTHLSDMLKSKSSKAVMMSGTVFRNCPISSCELPVSHETIFLAESEDTNMDDLANQLCAALRAVMREDTAPKVKVRNTKYLLNLAGTTNNIHVALTLELEGVQKCATLGHVIRFSDVRDGQTAGSEEVSTTQMGAVLYLDNIAFHALQLPDVRLLWSEDDRFIEQFSKEGINSLANFSSFKPFSLYPVCFVHDISFWESPQRVFEEADFFEVVREVADDVVTSVTLVDKFDNAAEGKTSRCYRLVFQSHDCALSYINSWKLQSVLRLRVAHQLGVTLR